MYYRISDNMNDGVGHPKASCREYTKSRTHQDSVTQPWIKSHTEIGLIRDVKIMWPLDNHDIEIQSPSTTGDNNNYWTDIFRDLNRYVDELRYKDPEYSTGKLEEADYRSMQTLHRVWQDPSYDSETISPLRHGRAVPGQGQSKRKWLLADGSLSQRGPWSTYRTGVIFASNAVLSASRNTRTGHSADAVLLEWYVHSRGLDRDISEGNAEGERGAGSGGTAALACASCTRSKSARHSGERDLCGSAWRRRREHTTKFAYECQDRGTHCTTPGHCPETPPRRGAATASRSWGCRGRFAPATSANVALITAFNCRVDVAPCLCLHPWCLMSHGRKSPDAHGSVQTLGHGRGWGHIHSRLHFAFSRVGLHTHAALSTHRCLTYTVPVQVNTSHGQIQI